MSRCRRTTTLRYVRGVVWYGMVKVWYGMVWYDSRNLLTVVKRKKRQQKGFSPGQLRLDSQIKTTSRHTLECIYTSQYFYFYTPRMYTEYIYIYVYMHMFFFCLLQFLPPAKGPSCILEVQGRGLDGHGP